MKSLLLRISRRLTVFEESDPDTVVEVLFSSDLQCSVFSIADEPRAIVRTYAEFLGGGFDRPPPLVAAHFDLEGLHHQAPVETAGDSPFEHNRASHRELHFQSAADLLEFVRRLMEQVEARTRRVEPSATVAYILERVAAADPEWTAILAARPKWKKWVEKQATR